MNKDIIESILGGESHRFREIIHEFTPMLRSYLSGHIRDFRDVQELLQEVFVAAYRGLESYNPEYHFGAWLKTIARNKMMSHLRKMYSGNNVMSELRIAVLDELPEPDFATCEDTSAVVLQLQRCIRKINDAEASKLIQERYFECRQIGGMAADRGIAENAISTRLYRIRKQLKKCIERGLKHES